MCVREGGGRGWRHYQVNLRVALELERSDATAVDDEFCQPDFASFASHLLLHSNAKQTGKLEDE